MLLTLLYLVFALSSLLLIVVILIQEGRGGGLGDAFGGAGQQTFGVGTSGITKFTAVVCVVMLASAVLIHTLGQRESDSLIQSGGPSLLDASPAGGTAPTGGAPTGGTDG